MENSNVRDIPNSLLPDVVEATIHSVPQWRSEGILTFGERVGNAWFYSRHEVLAIALAVAMARAGLGLKAAFEAVANPPPAIVAALAGADEATLTLWPRRERSEGSALPYAVKVVIDAAAIVRAAAARLDNALATERSRTRHGRLAFEPAPAVRTA
jgi:hypothetical protein